jgi:hypothetical protein
MAQMGLLFAVTASSMRPEEHSKPIRVFVHLARGFDAQNWEKRWAAGRIIGINERMPYGYFRAAEDGSVIFYSEDKTRNKLEQSVGSWIMSILGVDIVHAWDNRNGIYASDVVWTHTEIQYLAVLLLFRIFFWKRHPKLIAQSVWLFDRWQSLGVARRWILSCLVGKADILTFLSPENLRWRAASFQRFVANLSHSALTRIHSCFEKGNGSSSSPNSFRWKRSPSRLGKSDSHDEKLA